MVLWEGTRQVGLAKYQTGGRVEGKYVNRPEGSDPGSAYYTSPEEAGKNVYRDPRTGERISVEQAIARGYESGFQVDFNGTQRYARSKTQAERLVEEHRERQKGYEIEEKTLISALNTLRGGKAVEEKPQYWGVLKEPYKGKVAEPDYFVIQRGRVRERFAYDPTGTQEIKSLFGSVKPKAGKEYISSFTGYVEKDIEKSIKRAEISEKDVPIHKIAYDIGVMGTLGLLPFSRVVSTSRGVMSPSIMQGIGSGTKAISSRIEIKVPRPRIDIKDRPVSLQATYQSKILKDISWKDYEMWKDAGRYDILERKYPGIEPEAVVRSTVKGTELKLPYKPKYHDPLNLELREMWQRGRQKPKLPLPKGVRELIDDLIHGQSARAYLTTQTKRKPTQRQKLILEPALQIQETIPTVDLRTDLILSQREISSFLMPHQTVSVSRYALRTGLLTGSAYLSRYKQVGKQIATPTVKNVFGSKTALFPFQSFKYIQPQISKMFIPQKQISTSVLTFKYPQVSISKTVSKTTQKSVSQMRTPRITMKPIVIPMAKINLYGTGLSKKSKRMFDFAWQIKNPFIGIEDL